MYIQIYINISTHAYVTEVKSAQGVKTIHPIQVSGVISEVASEVVSLVTQV